MSPPNNEWIKLSAADKNNYIGIEGLCHEGRHVSRTIGVYNGYYYMAIGETYIRIRD